jgi:hypothetical protein
MRLKKEEHENTKSEIPKEGFFFFGLSFFAFSCSLSARIAMVFAVKCPNPKCRKFMLVEEREKTIVCLLCKVPFQIDVEPATPPQHQVEARRDAENN